MKKKGILFSLLGMTFCILSILVLLLRELDKINEKNVEHQPSIRIIVTEIHDDYFVGIKTNKDFSEIIDGEVTIAFNCKLDCSRDFVVGDGIVVYFDGIIHEGEAINIPENYTIRLAMNTRAYD